MNFRRLTSGDESLVQEMLNQFRGEKTSYGKVHHFLSNDANYIFACLDNQRVIGFVLAYQLARFDSQPNMLYIHQMDVAEEYRRQGIGIKLMEMMKQNLESQGLSKAFLITNKSNLPANRLYTAAGGVADNDDDIVYFFKANI